MSELTREEKIEAEIKEAKLEAIKINASIAEAIERNDREFLLIYLKRLSLIHARINLLLEDLENERQREFQRKNATECKVFKLIIFVLNILLFTFKQPHHYLTGGNKKGNTNMKLNETYVEKSNLIATKFGMLLLASSSSLWSQICSQFGLTSSNLSEVKHYQETKQEVEFTDIKRKIY
jgi:hypothetical protein